MPSDFFRCLVADDDEAELLGFVCATCAPHATLTHDSMETHDSLGTSLCIHSVVIDAKHRRRGLATRMLREYVQTRQDRRDKRNDLEMNLLLS